MEILEDYLDNFPGIVLFVSHDRYFIDRSATEVFELQPDRQWHRYSGGYSDLVAAREAEKEIQNADSTQPKAKAARTRKPSLSSKEKKELEDILVQLETLQKKRDELNDRLGQPGSYQELAQVEKERDQTQEKIDEMEIRWMELEEKKEKLAAA